MQNNHYQLEKKLDEMGLFSSKQGRFNDNQKAHIQFWNKYERPPKKEYWDYIVERRDLLVPQDIRERKGSFFTPQIWVELSQKYLTDVLGENWQDDYYIWDCTAGTGNLLTGLTNKTNIFASTLDQRDVDVIHSRIDTMNANSLTGQGSNLLHNHVFQFDFLNDDFSKLPKPLLSIINDTKERKKLVIYINPPYAESNGKVTNTRSQVQVSKTHSKYSTQLQKVSAELFAQFLIRIYYEIPDCIIGQFSTLKLLNAGNSKIFRANFLAKLERLFIIPANTFDNVKGKFPIGFFIWNTSIKEKFENIKVDIFDSNNKFLGKKKFYSYESQKGKINDWLKLFKHDDDEEKSIGILMADAPDFQHNNLVCIRNKKPKGHGICFIINKNNLKEAAIYLTVRKIFEHTWLNHNDQFLFPNDKWKKNIEFQNNCLVYALFNNKNRITIEEGKNNWIPFKEQEVGAREKFESRFMADFIAGKIKKQNGVHLFEGKEVITTIPLEFSEEAKAVFDAGRELWKYYHSQPYINVNASLYDIRSHFQGRDAKGRMNNKSKDETYMKLINELRENLKLLAQKIEPKVYEYGFLKK